VGADNFLRGWRCHIGEQIPVYNSAGKYLMTKMKTLRKMIKGGHPRFAN
jgi:hypothetical protein